LVLPLVAYRLVNELLQLVELKARLVPVLAALTDFTRPLLAGRIDELEIVARVLSVLAFVLLNLLEAFACFFANGFLVELRLSRFGNVGSNGNFISHFAIPRWRDSRKDSLQGAARQPDSVCGNSEKSRASRRCQQRYRPRALP